MGWRNVQLLYCEVDGTFPNHEADPTIIENMQSVKQALAHSDAQVGFGFDGDGDRMAPMTKQGNLIAGDAVLALYVQSLIKEHPGLTVVCDIKNSATLNKMMRSWGALPVLSASGHGLIKNEMRKSGAIIAGELSCHFFFKDRYFGFDDGIYAMLRLIEIMVKSKRSLQQLVERFPQTYSSKEFRVPYNADFRELILSSLKEWFTKYTSGQILTIDGVHVSFDDGWGIVRPSNTQPMLSIRFEADTYDDLLKIRSLFIQGLSLHMDAQYLESQLAL
jgi:phosphomannomutase/phosphoglucomutase